MKQFWKNVKKNNSGHFRFILPLFGKKIIFLKNWAVSVFDFIIIYHHEKNQKKTNERFPMKTPN